MRKLLCLLLALFLAPAAFAEEAPMLDLEPGVTYLARVGSGPFPSEEAFAAFIGGALVEGAGTPAYPDTPERLIAVKPPALPSMWIAVPEDAGKPSDYFGKAVYFTLDDARIVNADGMYNILTPTSLSLAGTYVTGTLEEHTEKEIVMADANGEQVRFSITAEAELHDELVNGERNEVLISSDLSVLRMRKAVD